MVPFLDLKAQHRALRDELRSAVDGVLDSCQFALGPAVKAFEDDFARETGARHAIAVNTGTSALQLALMAAGVGAGDEVITVPFTFVATVAAVGYIGARPVFVDVDRATGTMDPARVEAAITPRTKAILPVHLYGQPADLDPLVEIARRRGVALIEDACQAHLAEYRGRRVGAIGDLGAFSFYPGKNLGACGEGGMVVTNDDARARTIRMLRDWGGEKKYEHVLKGFNYRMDGIQGALLGVKLRHLAAWTEARRRNARAYDEALRNTGVETPHEADGRRHVYHLYAVRTPHREELQRHLGERGIQTGIHYPRPVHLLEAWQELGYKLGDFPESEAWANTTLSLPMFAELTTTQIGEVAAAVAEFKGSPAVA